VATLTPIVLLVVLVLGYYVPSTIMAKYDMSDDYRYIVNRNTTRARLIKLSLFTLLLMYPFISAQVLSIYQYTEVNQVKYLTADFTVLFDDDRWRAYLPYTIIMTIVYPVGVPLLFAVLLYRSRLHLSDRGVEQRLGFLFRGYHRRFYYFEVIDMMHKLMLCSLLKFATQATQSNHHERHTFLHT
jgi:hypothetical protein